MRSKSILLVTALLGLSLGACQKSNKAEVVDFNAMKQKSIPDKDKAELIALGAEKLVYSDGFKFANKQFAAALELDPTNVRARFYQAFLGIAKIGKGALVKIDPVVSRLDLNAQRQYQASVDQIPKSHTKDFLMKGQPTINTENDAQNEVRKVQDALRELRTTLTALKTEGAELVAHTAEARGGVTFEQILHDCPVAVVSANTYSMPDCQDLVSKDVKLNWADFEALKVAAAAYIIYLSPATVYDLKGAESVARKLARYTAVTDEMIVRAVKQEPSLGKLADGRVLGEIVSMGAEGIEALKLAQTKQADLCTTGLVGGANRPGFLFVEGFCVDQKLMAAAQTAQASLQGAASVVLTPNYVTYFDASKFLKGSIPDLKAQLPNKFDKCQQAIGLPDPTLGGVFPSGDFVEVQRLQNPEFLNPYCPN